MFRHFVDRLVRAVLAKKSVLCCGLDPQLQYMPRHLIDAFVASHGSTFEAVAWIILTFNKAVIDAVEPFVVAVKPNIAFYERYGSWGIWAYEQTIAYAKSKGLLVITDVKRCDGGDTADAYAGAYLGTVPMLGGVSNPHNFIQVQSPVAGDCMTVVPHIGSDLMSRLLGASKVSGSGMFVVVKTSFKPNSEIEELETNSASAFSSGLKVWQEIAMMVDNWGKGTEGESGYRNVGVVIGATKPEDGPWMRKALPRSFFLIPGYGMQGAGPDEAIITINKEGLGGLINNSRGLTFAYCIDKSPFKREGEKFAEAAGEAAEFCRNQLNEALKRAGKSIAS